MPAVLLLLQEQRLASLEVAANVQMCCLGAPSCGKELIALVAMHAAPLTILHGSTSSCHSPPLMALR